MDEDLGPSGRPSARGDDGDLLGVRGTGARYDWTTDDPTTAVVETVALNLDRDPTALRPLYECIDTDALDELFGAGETPEGLVVEFVYHDRRVEVHGDGRVTLEEAATEPDR